MPPPPHTETGPDGVRERRPPLAGGPLLPVLSSLVALFLRRPPSTRGEAAGRAPPARCPLASPRGVAVLASIGAPRTRRTFARLDNVLEVPNLIDIQKKSFDWLVGTE